MDADFAERHRSVRAQALGTPRGRLIGAMVECVGARGFSTVTLTDIVGRAHVSRSTFYEHFGNKEHCFTEAVHTGVEIIRTRIADELARLPEDADPRQRIATMISTFCSVVAAEPDFARLILVESLLVGDATAEFRDLAVDRVATLYRDFHDQARTADPAIPELPDAVIALIPDAIGERTRRVLVREGAHRVPDMAPTFIEFANTVLGLAPVVARV
ncbi:TetR/AcrR family transcriptional regulator [Nocardia nova]|uniref:TetR/AcrR family transcriptional regulator n=1 Tax=Nocardia nova TaxID=37330 RepID=A0A2S6AH07_9NOCA|nr:TetR/AcrR family transcriptional regulator [Nocardia nova]PPJ28771.1 TetR/AcrR family transcriptional regulator [Nocardia nova]PPJ34023.1 TetR/AcrR family transcriptional regulator [Nocardia nova]